MRPPTEQRRPALPPPEVRRRLNRLGTLPDVCRARGLGWRITPAGEATVLRKRRPVFVGTVAAALAWVRRESRFPRRGGRSQKIEGACP